MLKKWIINTPDEQAVRKLSLEGGLSPLAAKVLASSGIDTIEKAAVFFGQGVNDEDIPYNEASSDPMEICDMDKACQLISSAIDEGTLICVYGDYDCDGVTATAVLAGYLRDTGANVMTYINEREQGYGMNSEAVRELADLDVGLIVTVDNGISAIEEARLCRELGITLVITDHHQPGEVLPAADAVIDPHRSDCTCGYRDFCGCGVALKLIAAMEGGDMDFAAEQYSDLAAIATVADVVPLTGENREIVRQGLHYLENTDNFGLKALIAKSGIKSPYTSTSAAFSLAPRINAAGRIGSPSLALSLLMSESPDEAEELAEKVCELNSDRKNFENKVIEDISEQIKLDPSLLDGRVLIFKGKGWHHGVVGIAAARCTEKFGKPAFLMSQNEGETELRGSARSIEGFNIFKALTYAAQSMTKFGGHSGAGGFSLKEDEFDRFSALINEYAAVSAGESGAFVPLVKVCGAVRAEELTADSVKGLSVLEPFGEGNPYPVFLLGDCTVNEVIPLSGGVHTKVMLLNGQTLFTGIMFGMKTSEFPYKKGDIVNALISPEINNFNNRCTVNLRISDIRKKGLNQAQIIAAEDTYYAFRRGEKIDSRLIPRITPERADLAAVYKAMGKDRLAPFGIFARLRDNEMNYCRFLICLDIFDEAGLIDYDRCAGKASVIQGASKADTDSTPTMQKLKKLTATV